MKAFVVHAPRKSAIEEVEKPRANKGEVVVDVVRAGVCGTDVEFFKGDMAYFETGEARYPIRLGHEWCGVVTEVGQGVDEHWIGKRVTGDTMLGCQQCKRCTSGMQHVCAERFEIGILDCIGDLYLAGYSLIGKVNCYQGGHDMTRKLLEALIKNKSSWNLTSLKSKNLSPVSSYLSNQLVVNL